MRTWILFAVLVGGVIGFAATVRYGADGIRQAQQAEAEFPGTPEPSISANISVDGAPVTAVVVTQCSGLLAVYLTMPNGKLIRFDQDSGLPWVTLLDMANTAAQSERIEVSCDSIGVEGYEEKAAPVSLTFF